MLIITNNNNNLEEKNYVNIIGDILNIIENFKCLQSLNSVFIFVENFFLFLLSEISLSKHKISFLSQSLYKYFLLKNSLNIFVSTNFI